jgi:hypothetical protein
MDVPGKLIDRSFFHVNPKINFPIFPKILDETRRKF